VRLLAHGCEGARSYVSPSTKPPSAEPRFSCVVSAPGEASIPLATLPEEEKGREREREENPRPFTGLLAVAAVSYLGLRGAPLYRRTATLGFTHLTFSTPFPILSLSDLALRSPGVPSSADVLSILFSHLASRALPASVYPAFSPAHSLHRPP